MAKTKIVRCQHRHEETAAFCGELVEVGSSKPWRKVFCNRHKRKPSGKGKWSIANIKAKRAPPKEIFYVVYSTPII